MRFWLDYIFYTLAGTVFMTGLVGLTHEDPHGLFFIFLGLIMAALWRLRQMADAGRFNREKHDDM